MTFTTASLFSGGGLADIGAEAAGLTPTWGLEKVPWVAQHFKGQIGTEVKIMDISKADPSWFERPYHLHASPPCPNFSVAKSDRAETNADLALASMTARFIREMRSPIFTLENVIGYRRSQSWQLIANALNEVYGLSWDFRLINFADFGVPQTRRRMVVRAVLDRALPPWPAKEPHRGWLQAIEDLLDELPESDFADWQIKRLKGAGFQFDGSTLIGNSQGASLVEGTSAGKRPPTVCGANQPAFTVMAGKGGRVHRAILMRGDNSQGEWGKGYRRGDEPAPTVMRSSHKHASRAFIVGQGEKSRPKAAHEPAQTVMADGNQIAVRAQLEGRVVKLTPRALDRFQTVPDSYELPEHKTKAVQIIGNGVPCLGMQKILENLLEGA